MAAQSKSSTKWVLKLLLCFLFISIAITIAAESSLSQNLEVQRQLKNLNRTPVKSIKSPDGDIIDCVHVSHQPAFDHPDLKNHKIQMRPNFDPQGRNLEDSKVSSSSSSSSESKLKFGQLWQKNGKCPEGTIPMRRTREDDILRASSVQHFGKKKHNTVPQPTSAQPQANIGTQTGHQHAIAYVQGDKYYGAKATMNVWKPTIDHINEFSLSQIWLLGGNFGSDLNSIEAGWQVSPQLYGDNNTRLFTYWTSDAYKSTGCYNLLCSGFVQTSSEIALGASISPLSSYGGDQYEITILVWKDPKQGNWWMQYGNEHVMGYWPASLFSYLSDSVSVIEWGGEVVNSNSDGQHTTTQMGSGHFPEEGFGKASYFKNLQVVDSDNVLLSPSDLQTFTDQSSCYNIQNGNSDDWGSHFYYGGPGRNPNCP